MAPPKRGSNQQTYLLRRLARDAPEILERVKAGEFKSARAAAIEAGIIRPVATVRLVDDPVWAQAQAQLQEAVKGKPGRPAKKKEEENPAQCAGNNPTNGASWKPTDRKSRLIRTPRRLTTPSLTPATYGTGARREQCRSPAPVAAMDLPHAT